MLGARHLPDPLQAGARPLLFVGNHTRFGLYDLPLLVRPLLSLTALLLSAGTGRLLKRNCQDAVADHRTMQLISPKLLLEDCPQASSLASCCCCTVVSSPLACHAADH